MDDTDPETWLYLMQHYGRRAMTQYPEGQETLTTVASLRAERDEARQRAAELLVDLTVKDARVFEAESERDDVQVMYKMALDTLPDLARAVSQLTDELDEARRELAAVRNVWALVNKTVLWAGLGSLPNVDRADAAGKTLENFESVMATVPAPAAPTPSDFTELMDEVAREIGHPIPDRTHALIGNYISRCFARAAPATEREALRESVRQLAGKYTSWLHARTPSRYMFNKGQAAAYSDCEADLLTLLDEYDAQAATRAEKGWTK